MNFNSKKKEYENKKRKSPIKNEKLKKKKIKIKDAKLLLKFSKKVIQQSNDRSIGYNPLNRIFLRFLRGWAELIKKNPERAKQLSGYEWTKRK